VPVRPKISVVVPSFNQAVFLEPALRSILDQNYHNLELIVIDGGSTDGSPEIIRHYSDQLSYWVSEPDGGQTYGLIKGFAKSTGEIQCWINSDDLMAAGCLAEVADFFTKRPEAMAVYGNATWIDRGGRELREQREIDFYRFIWLHSYNYIPGMSMYWRRSLYERVGGLDPAFDLAMDSDLWDRFSQVTRIHHVRRNWSYMRYYPEQKTRALSERSDAEFAAIQARHGAFRHSPKFRLKKLIAQMLRVSMKFASGCYNWNYRRNMIDGLQ
jgi:glycosyltransferase involved in cell wall biosynthesis